MKAVASETYDSQEWHRITKHRQLLSIDWKGDYSCEPEFVDDYEDANAISSLSVSTGKHILAIDIDMPVVLVPSTNEGRFHLYIDKEIEYSAWINLMRALSEAGIIEEGYYSASEERGYSALRLPWVKKESID